MKPAITSQFLVASDVDVDVGYGTYMLTMACLAALRHGEAAEPVSRSKDVIPNQDVADDGSSDTDQDQ